MMQERHSIHGMYIHKHMHIDSTGKVSSCFFSRNEVLFRNWRSRLTKIELEWKYRAWGSRFRGGVDTRTMQAKADGAAKTSSIGSMSIYQAVFRKRAFLHIFDTVVCRFRSSLSLSLSDKRR